MIGSWSSGGTRAREHLRQGVEEALVALGQGFVSHADNQALRADLQHGALPVKDYFNQLLRLVYRLLFLLTVEERGLLHPEGTSDAARALYASGYGIRRLRERSVKRSAHDRFSDLWEATQVVCRGLAAGEPRLGLPALAGIFAANQCPSLDAGKLENRALLLAVFKLAWLREDGSLSRVNWRDMGPEELGSVYESLLELIPQITEGGRRFAFATGGETKGNARKTTGSYYTPDSLVQVLLDSALEPAIADAIARNPANPVEALLGLSIVDPACGSGHFLLAAARSALRKRNKKGTEGQRSLDTFDANVEALAKKQERWDGVLGSPEYRHQKFVADAWCAAFVWPKQPGAQADAAPTNELWRQLQDGQSHPPELTAKTVGELADQYRFFHWHLQFPQVFAKGGFDVVLGNPPWDTLSPDAKEFFSIYEPEIRFQSKGDQDKTISRLLEDAGVAAAWERNRREIFASAFFLKESGRFTLFAPGHLGKGDFNLYRLFVELALRSVQDRGFAAQIVPDGLYAGANSMAIRKQLFESFRLDLLLGFENAKEVWFPGVDSRAKFSLYAAQNGETTDVFRAAFCIRSPDTPIGTKLVESALRLTCTGPEMNGLWDEFANLGTVPPRAQGQVPGAIDATERLNLRADIEARLALLYGLSVEEVGHVLDTFPIVQKADEQACGEFRTKVLVLHRYEELSRPSGGGAVPLRHLAKPEIVER